jgi:hypothetical protein
MNPKNILPFLLGVATAGPLAVGSQIFAQVSRADVREPFQAGVVDGFCVYVDKSQVDAGQGGLVVRSKFEGARIQANATLLSLVPQEDPSQCSVSAKLTGPALAAVTALYTDHIQAPLKAACRMP